MEKRDVYALAIIAGVIGVLIYLLRDQLPTGYGSQNQPDRIDSRTGFDTVFPMLPAEHFATPDIIVDPVILPIRYPPRAGHEISTIIQHGYGALYQPRSELRAWMDNPPSLED